MHRFRMLPIVAGMLAAAVAPLAAQQPTADELARPVPLDPQVNVGTLPNGMRYFIRTNSFPAKRAELRLVVRAGSALEDPDQLGLAHFVEHMAFNGTAHFPKQELVSYLQSIGMRFGPDVNAYTSFDETVYMLQLPTDDEKFLLKGIDILGDWAHEQAFDSTEVEAERGVVVEEWRLRRGAASRMQDKQFPVIFKGSRYADRLPIGDPEILRTFRHDALKRFYQNWYRPDLMAVLAVGDFDPARVEQLLRDRFSKLPKPQTATSLPDFPIPPHAETYAVVTSDPEATNSSVAVYHMLPPRDHMKFGGYRERTIEQVFFSMLNARLAEISQKPDAPFVFGGLGRGYFVRSSDVLSVSAGAKEGGIERALDAVMTEVERAARHGFTQGELDRAKANAAAARDRQFAQREQRTSASRIDELVRHIVNGEDAAGNEVEYEMQLKIIPAITLAEMNELARRLPTLSSRVVVASSPAKAGIQVPTEAQLLAVLDAVRKKDVEPYRDVAVTAPLIAKLPAPGRILEERKLPAVDATEWKLSNGVRVVLRPTDFQDDQVMMSGWSPGGTSLVPDSLYIHAMLSPAFVNAGGLGEFSQVDLRKALSGKTASVNLFLGGRAEGLSASASRPDIETMLQLTYLRFTAPRRDSAAVAAFREGNIAMLGNRAASPMSQYSDTIQVTMSQGHVRGRPMTADVFRQVDLERALHIYQDRFSDASDFTFVIVGDFDVDSIRPHVLRYLGGLPALNRKEQGRDVGMRPPTGLVRKVVHAGTEPVSQTYISFTGPFQYTAGERYLLTSLGEVLQNRLHDKLREALGGTYNVNVSASGGRDEPATYATTIRFGSAPDRADELTKSVIAEIQAVQKDGPTAAEIEKVREAQRRAHELNLKQNGFWLGGLMNAYSYGDEPGVFLDYPKLLDTLTPDALAAMARKYLRLDNYVHITLLPEKPKT